MARPRQGEQVNLKTVDAVVRALQVLKFLQHSPGGATPTVLATGTGLNRTTVMRILVTLASQGFVSWTPSAGTYSLGPAALELAAGYLSTSDLPSVSLPELIRLRDATGETASIYVRDGLYRVCIQRVESLQGLRRSVQLGQRLLLFAGASGKVLLSVMSEAVRESLYTQSPGTESELKRLRGEVSRTISQGWALSIEEREQGVAAVAVPIVYRAGADAVALSISGPSNRLSESRLVGLAPLLQEAARRIAIQLFA